MDTFLSLLPDKVKKGTKIVTSEQLGMKHLLHISTNGKIKEFTPFITQRSANNEDRTVPRISTAPTLLGCLIGYCAATTDFQYPLDENRSYKGGWYIYGIPFEKAIKPAANLLWDQRYSDEHWLVTYNEDTRHYKPVILGKVFYKEIVSVARTGKMPFKKVTMLVEVNSDEPLKFGANVSLTKGYWEITGDEPSNNVESWKHDKEYAVKEISKAEYSGIKKLSADMLSMPTSYNW